MEVNLRALPIGQVLNDYRIEGILGQGGFGITYLATDTSLQTKVAIKEYFPREFAVRDRTLTIRASGNNEDRENFTWGLGRFLEEARILARFDHPNIVSVRRFFETNGTAYLVMDYCDGEPLDEIVKRDGTLSREKLERILPQLLDGLEQIHSNNYLHRDIKPANIYIRSNGTPVLLDFGAARQEIIGHSRSVTSLATDGYAALEQYSTRGKQGTWTDVYGLGATLYRCVTGEKPQASADRILDDTHVPAASKASGRYSKSLLLAIDAAMGVRPEQRPQKVSQFRAMLEKNIAAASPPAPKLTQPPAPRQQPSWTPPPPPAPRPGSIAEWTVFGVGVLIFLIWLANSTAPPQEAPTIAPNVATVPQQASPNGPGVGFVSVFVSDRRSAGWAAGHPTQLAADNQAKEVCKTLAKDDKDDGITCKKAFGGQSRCLGIARDSEGALGWTGGSDEQEVYRTAIETCKKHGGTDCSVPVQGAICG